MTITLKDIKHLEVMANLINAEPAPTPQINIKSLLSLDVSKELTVDEKILSLCSKLRRDGFDKQADGLENKFINYKSASTHLYRAFDEDGEDLVNAAHPDGEVKVNDSQSGHGSIGTTVTKHKKIVDMVTKTPTGKLASYIDQCRDVLNKSAQVDPASAAAYLLYNMWSGLKQSFGDLNDKAEVLEKKLNTLQSDSDALKFPKLINQIQQTILYVDKIRGIAPQISSLQVQPEGKGKEIKKMKVFLESVQNELNKLYGIIISAHSASENSLDSKLYHLLVTSNFADAKISVKEFSSSLTKTIAALTTLEGQTDLANTNVTKKPDLSFDNESGDVKSPKQLEMDKLVGWQSNLSKKQMDDVRKQHINSWIAGQIKELNAAVTPEEIAKVVSENKDFEAKGII